MSTPNISVDGLYIQSDQCLQPSYRTNSLERRNMRTTGQIKLFGIIFEKRVLLRLTLSIHSFMIYHQITLFSKFH